MVVWLRSERQICSSAMSRWYNLTSLRHVWTSVYEPNDHKAESWLLSATAHLHLNHSSLAFFSCCCCLYEWKLKNSLQANMETGCRKAPAFYQQSAVSQPFKWLRHHETQGWLWKKTKILFLHGFFMLSNWLSFIDSDPDWPYCFFLLLLFYVLVNNVNWLRLIHYKQLVWPTCHSYLIFPIPHPLLFNDVSGPEHMT